MLYDDFNGVLTCCYHRCSCISEWEGRTEVFVIAIKILGTRCGIVQIRRDVQTVLWGSEDDGGGEGDG